MGWILIAVLVLWIVVGVAGAFRDARPMDLPTVSEYMREHGHSAEHPIRCRNCGSTDIRDHGQRHRRDRTRFHRCERCGTVLYSTRR